MTKFKLNLAVVYTALAMLSLSYSATLHAETVRDSYYVESENEQLYMEVIKPNTIDKPTPVVIFLFGSGEFSTISAYQNFVRFFFTEPLLKQGFSIAVFDKRGTGKSTGNWYNTSFEDRAIDAFNVGRFLQSQEWVDASKIYVAGHSQGGWIAQMAVADNPEVFAGGISMAGPTFNVREQLINDYASRYECGKQITEAQAYQKAERNVNWTLRFVSMFGWWGNLKQLKVIKDFTPEDYLRRTENPLLLMFAENDPLVSPQHSIETLNSLFPKGIPEHISYYVGVGQEHAFKVAPKCYSGDWKDVYYSEESRDAMVDWLQQQF